MKLKNLFISLKDKQRQLLIFLGRKTLYVLDNLIAHFSLVGNQPILDLQKFPWTTELEENWTTIRDELEQVLKGVDKLPKLHDVSPDQYYISKNNLWKTYNFYAYGIKVVENCQRCPETTHLLEKIHGMTTAWFSILLPGMHIPEHRGPSKSTLVYHLGLIIPNPKTSCRIRVEKNINYWEEGKSFIFDETYVHEAWNDSDSIRVILLAHVTRPTLFPISLINKLIVKLISLTPYVQDHLVLLRKWNENFEDDNREKASTVSRENVKS